MKHLKAALALATFCLVLSLVMHTRSAVKIIVVPAGADLQTEINAAVSGDTLSLANSNYGSIIINKSLTIEGNGARIVNANTDPAIDIPPNTDNVTLKNLDVSASGFTYNVIRIGSTGTAQDTLDEAPANITLDHVNVHGSPTEDSQRGIAANGANVRITNSRIYEIHFRGVDSQAVAIWNGPGPLVITDSYLEAAGENFMPGGADPSIPNLVPADIEIRRCTFFKPLSWKVGDPSYAGYHWTVKNLLELKNSRRVVIDGNIFINNWTDAQTGWAVLFKSQNQDGGCPWCVTEDVTFTNNTVKGSENGINVLAYDPYHASAQLKRIRIANNLWQVSNAWFQGTGMGLKPDGSVTDTGADDVVLEHNTHLQQSGNVMTLYGKPTVNFVVRNNLGARTGYGIKGDGMQEGIPTLTTFAPNFVFAGNVLSGATDYPTGNFYPATFAEVQLGSDFRLAATSPFKGKGTDGKDPGVDMDALLAAQSGVTPPTTPSPAPTATPTPTPVITPTPLPLPILKYGYESRSWPQSSIARLQLLNDMGALGYRLAQVIGSTAYFEKVK